MRAARLAAAALATAPAAAAAAEPEAWTLDGVPLYPPVFDPLTAAAQAAQLSIAEDNLRADACAPTHDPAKEVWRGRRIAYQWRYREGIDAFSAAIAAAPRYPELLRHRGHRYVTTRNFSLAEADLARAAGMVARSGAADGWEEDGAPGPYNLPLSTKHFNILYHLGLARFLQGDWAAALDAYHQMAHLVMPAGLNDESLAANAHWEYMAHRRMGDEAAANRSIAAIHDGMRAVDDGAYLNLTLMYKGERNADDLLGGDPSDLDIATLGYGIGNWHYYNGRQEEAVAMWRRVVGTPYWAAFGYIAAEADLHRLHRHPRPAARAAPAAAAAAAAATLRA